MQEKKKGADYIIKKIHIKSIKVTSKHETNSLKIFADIETPKKFRQNDYAIRKITINNGHTNTVKKRKGLLNILSI